MKRKPISAIVVLAFLATASSSFGARISLTAEADRPTCTVGDTFTLSVVIKVEEGEIRNAPELPKIEGLVPNRPSYGGPVTMIVNGKKHVEHRLNYSIYAQKVGTYVISGISLEGENEVFTANPVTVEVVEPVADARIDINQTVQAVVEVDRTEVHRGEQVVLRVEVYSRVPLRDSPDLVNLESFDGFFEKRFQTGGFRQYPLEINGVQFYKGELPIRFALFPVTSGELTIPALQLRAVVPDSGGRRRGVFGDPFFDDPFFSRGKRVMLKTDPIVVKVKPLPEQGRPDGYFGAVGELDLTVRAEPTEAKVGDPVMLTVELVGDCNYHDINQPIWPKFDGFAPHDEDPTAELLVVDGRLILKKVWKKGLLVREGNVSRIGPVRLPYFDTAKEAYVDLASTPIEVSIEAAAFDRRDVVLMNTGEEVEITSDSFRYIVTDSDRLEDQSGRLHRAGLFWSAHLIPVLLVVSAGYWRRRRDRIESDEGYARKVRTPKAVRRILGEAEASMKSGDPAGCRAHLSRALLELIEGRFAVSARGLLPPEVKARLRSAGVDPDLARSAAELLHSLDNARFAGGAGEGDLERDMATAKDLLRKLQKAGTHGTHSIRGDL